MNAPDLLRAGGWRTAASAGGSVDWQHPERHGETRFELGAATLDELAHVTAQRDLLQPQLDRALELLGEAAPALLQGAAELRKVVARVTRAGEPHWLVKDFHVLYASAHALAEACNGRGDGKPYWPLRALEAQLQRLKPAFDETEAERAERGGGHG